MSQSVVRLETDNIPKAGHCVFEPTGSLGNRTKQAEATYMLRFTAEDRTTATFRRKQFAVLVVPYGLCVLLYGLCERARGIVLPACGRGSAAFFSTHGGR